MLLRHYLEQGMFKAGIPRRLGISERTVYRWIAAGQLDRELDDGPVRNGPRRPQSSKLDPYKGVIAERLAEYPELRVFADRVLAAGVRFSMDGRGRFRDNILIERLWRSLKYEVVYLHELRDGLDAEGVVGSWIDFYNEVRPHSALGGRTPGDAYREGTEAL